MRTGLAQAALRAHRPAFVGTAVAALFAATVVSAATSVLMATSTAHADELSADARRQLRSSGVGDMAAVLLIGSIYMSIFVVVSTMGTAVAQQHRELAMVRSIGAKPRQVRRAVAGQALAAAANTLSMISFERRRDIALLRVIGTQARQVRAIAAWEAVVVAGTALLLGGATALITLAPVLDEAFGSPVPYIPWTVLAGIGSGTLLLTLLATGLPVRSVMRRRAISVVGAT
ncbi:FtsX-like permease family protein [Streptomyces montanus]|uniref:FtsX-like permease family protein n=1 Tax=Streptomyces montanus TaxID=2580423 RepID=A0A5R9F9J0_9ACTN|nr:FtsX-like permease family protein [Streptomyces montanus]TLS39731.1 FtsX-like permease family protein [Streptomyces montanus]